MAYETEICLFNPPSRKAMADAKVGFNSPQLAAKKTNKIHEDTPISMVLNKG